MPLAARLVACLVVASALPAAAQQAAPRLDAHDHAIRQRRIAITGDLGLPPLQPLTADSPLDTMYFADRVPVPQEPTPPAEGGPGQKFSHTIPPGPNGTGTDKAEIFQYQVPGTYDEDGDALPLVIAYHGFGGSAESPADNSTIDELCNIRGWMYLAPTGIDDQLYGAPVVQTNVTAAIQWMLDNFNIDPDRIYMVGFSMGGGVACNYVARHRDPDGIMIAALGVVSATMDWVLEFNNAPGVQGLLMNPYNFGGPPGQKLFEYQQASTLHFDPDTAPPLPGVLQLPFSMATNLGSTPTYVTWDVGDTTIGVTAEQPVLLGVLAGLGGTFVSKPVFGTSPAHSWAVLNEPELFDFFDGKVVNRAPLAFEALIDRDEQVSWTEVTQRFTGTFSHVSGVANVATRTLVANDQKNVANLEVHVDAAGILGPNKVHVSAEGDPDFDGVLQIDDLSAPPAWLTDPNSGVLLEGTESAPLDEGLITPLPALSFKTVDMVSDSAYISDLFTAPEPAPLGSTISLTLDAPGNPNLAFLVVGFEQALGTVHGHKLLVQLGPPTFLISLALGPGGKLVMPLDVPDEAQLAGLEVLMQGVFAAGNGFHSLSNLWLLDIE